MSNQTPSSPVADPARPPSSDPPEGGNAARPQPSTQGKVGFRKRLPVWMQEMPQFGRFQPVEPDPEYHLLEKDKLEGALADVPEAIRQEIYDDIDYMEYELMRLFRQRDHTAKFNQNRYRRLQINYLILAVAATLIGSLQVIALASSPEVMPIFAFMETVVALLTAFLAAVGGREPPQQLWLNNRRRAEQLRREFFRFLTRMPPYDEMAETYQRRMLLSQRAADINRGMYPQEAGAQGGDLNDSL